MLNKNIQKKIVNNLIEHIKKFYSCESFYESAMAYWQQLVNLMLKIDYERFLD